MSYSIYSFIIIKVRTKYYDLMTKQFMLTLLVIAFGSYGFARLSEEPFLKVNIAVNTDQGSTHESALLVKEESKWRALNDRKSGAR